MVLEGVDRGCIDDTLRKSVPSINNSLTKEVFTEIKMASVEGYLETVTAKTVNIISKSEELMCINVLLPC